LGLVAAACGDDDATTTTAAGATTTTDAMAEWPERIVFGLVPSQEAEELQDNVDVFAQVLSDALGIEVEGIVTTDYTALGVALGTGEVDMGFFGPAGFVLADRTYDNLVLLAQAVRFGDPTYHTQWYTNDPSICTGDPVEGTFYYDADNNVVPVGPTDSPQLQVGWNGDDTRDEAVSAGLRCPEAVPLADVLPGKQIAFPGETSTSGYIFPQIELMAAGITPDQYTANFFGGSHDLAVAAVYGQPSAEQCCDVGTAFNDARRNVRDDFSDVGEVVIVFNIGPRIANDVIAVTEAMPADLQDAIFNAITAYLATEEGELLFEDLYSWTDLTRADATTEDSLIPIGDAIDELGFSD
jgi:phosphonate transport system substrate-binding protein